MTSEYSDAETITLDQMSANVSLTIGHPRNRDLLQSWFSTFPNIDVSLNTTSVPADESIDLYIVDDRAAEFAASAIARDKRAAEPVYQPILGILSTGTTNPSDRKTIRQTADVAIEVPIEKASLRWHVRSLLHQRELSKALAERNAEIERSREHLRLLNQILKHDIGNNISTILMGVELLLETGNEASKPHIDRVRRAAEDSVDLIQTAREYAEWLSKPEDRRLNSVPLKPVLAGQLETARLTYPSARFETATEIPDVSVQADDLLSTIFRNLLTNAVIHNDTDEPVVSLSVKVTDEDVVVEIEDNGPGVPDDQKTTIFGEDELGLDSPGTGLGLFFVDSLVSEYEGSVTVEDSSPRGARFSVRFPRGTSIVPDTDEPDPDSQ